MIARVASPVPTMAGTPCSRQTIAACDIMPPPSATQAEIRVNTGVQLGFVVGATRIFPVELWIDQPGHLLGTARMGRDPERSVVNEWGRSHDVKNLFIVDGSVFVTGGGVNPTSTIQAVALYIADQIKQRLANLFD